MTALSFIDEELPSRRDRRAIGGLVVALLPTIALLAIALLFVSRRLVGAFTMPLDLMTATLFALIAIAYDAASRVFVGRMFLAHAHDMPNVWPIVFGFEWIVRWGALAIAGTSLILPATSSAVTTLVCLPLICNFLVPRLIHSASGWLRPTVVDESRTPASPTTESSRPPSRRLRQETTRFVDAAGRDVIEGTAVAQFAPGQRIVSLHLAFCPPFARAPEIACGVASEAAAEVKVVQALAYAARFDVKLSTVAATSLDVPVSFSARCDG
jgi:hypothetical protein